MRASVVWTFGRMGRMKTACRPWTAEANASLRQDKGTPRRRSMLRILFFVTCAPGLCSVLAVVSDQVRDQRVDGLPEDGARDLVGALCGIVVGGEAGP